MASRNWPPFIPSSAQGPPELVERMRWVVGLRWMIVLALLLVGVLGGVSVVHLGLALLVLVYNLVHLRLSKQTDFGQSSLTALVRYGQVPVDLVVFTALVHLSGGVTSPVFVLYFLYIFVGLAILPPTGAYWVAAIAALCYGTLAALEAFLPGFHIGSTATQGWWIYLGYFLVVSATLMITAYIANYFARLLTRDEVTIRRQLDDMNTLYTVTRKIATNLNYNEVMSTMVSQAMDLTKPRACWLLLFNEQGEGKIGATRGVSPEELRRYRDNPITADHPIIKQLRAESKGIYAVSVEDAPDLKPLILCSPTQSFYALPMLDNDRLIGILNLNFDEPYTMPTSRWKLLNAMAQQAALAIERAQLFTDAERAAREMTGLYHIGLATTSSLQIDEVLRLLYEQVNSVLHPDSFYIGLYDEDQAELRFDIFVEKGEFFPPFQTRLGDGICTWVIRNRRPVFISAWDSEVEQMPFEAGLVGTPTQSIISVPLMAKNKMVGVMSAQAVTANAFDYDHLRLLTSIAGQAALALENAMLHAQVHEQAQRDSLTGVFNHGVFINKLQNVVQQADFNDHNVALIMLDIDRFKQYNDTYGHMIGDDVLRSIVVAIQNHLKSTDVVGRWGGEEFGIILPEVSRTQAKLIAERIRQTAAHATLTDRHNRTIPSPTVSQGIALYPEDASSIDELIDKADTALYSAKDLGRDKITEWAEVAAERARASQPVRG